MSTTLTRTYSLRKTIRPIYDIEEEEDEQRRDSSGRKRVAVVHCLLESSTDDNEDVNVNIEPTSRILWLRFDEICHIRFTLSRTKLTLDKQYSEIRRREICFRCRKRFNEFFFFLSFLPFLDNYETCFICQQHICEKCSYTNFHLPASKLSIPIRIQTLIKPPPIPIESKNENIKKSGTHSRTICYDCLQIFSEHISTSQQQEQPPASPLRRTASLPPMSSKKPNEVKYTRHRRRRPVQNN